MKTLLATTALVLASASSMASTLLTLSYKVTIVGCEEYVVACDNARYFGVNRKTGESLTLSGRSLHNPGPDGITPARLLGYEFKSGNTTYFVGADGLLRISQGSKILVEQQGTWE